MALDGVVYMTIQSFWISLIIGTLSLFFIRLRTVKEIECATKEAWLILLLPCSIGYFLFVPLHAKFSKIYRILIIVFFIFTVLATILLFFNHFQPDIL